jgi:hypothetical protein
MDAMMRRNAVRDAIQNAQAIDWARTHTLQDLHDLADEMSGLGADVGDITRLLDDLADLDRSLGFDTRAAPETSERVEAAA